MKKIEMYEPWFFIIFGVFQLHRIWGLFDRTGYAEFWMGVMEAQGVLYCTFMGIRAALCLLGIVTFFVNLHKNYWWRWVYLLGGGYVLFDLAAVSMGWKVWQELLAQMFNVNLPYWNMVWGGFIVSGGASVLLGVVLMMKKHVRRRTIEHVRYTKGI